ncbi:LysR family transcriptional regulator [Erythrobacter sp. SG61-1L]|uniref:LysR family transcriptional regulator n=1 Tax=Erythrobacter sp. SG61-1L TaxID=1603897 RepID=UPI0006C93798|nr:LysR family transcriptional regulator [Erythrobacter sp. SG61-1L]KPL67153.1 LysR family transcriptional regulator [Erythrobacter sp. SG61-1L]
MRFKGLDLNLLVALDVLLQERSVSRAAERLNLSQPALSAALAKLRDFFGDPLLVAQGRRMIPTAEALAMQAELESILGRVNEMVVRSTSFAPATSRRIFRICASDYLVAVLFPGLVAAIQQVAPSVGLDLVPPSEEAQIALERGELDLLVTPEEHCVHGHPAEFLFEERHVVAGWSENPLLATRLTEQNFFEAGHVAVKIGQANRASFAESHLDSLARKRRIEITTTSFTTVPDLLVGTHRLAVMHERLASLMAQRLPIGWQELPFAFPAMKEMIQFNRARCEDEGLLWLIGQLRATLERHP